MTWPSYIFSTAIVFFVLLVTIPDQARAQIDDFNFDISAISDLSGLSGLTDSITQFNGIFETLSLDASPRYPEPRENFTLNLTATNDDMTGATIRWLVDGEEIIEFQNERSASFTAGELGDTRVYEVVIEKSSGETERLSLDITPVEIDIVVEGLTTIPDFYAGRGVPSANTRAHATAIINTGESISRKNLTYKWEIGGTTLNNGPVKGKMNTEFVMPLDSEVVLGVTILDGNTEIGQELILIRPVEPEIIFYEENPMNGTSEIAFGEQVDVIGNQISVRGEPYYIAPFINQPNYIIEWGVSGQRFNNAGVLEPNVATFRGNGTQSTAVVSLRMVDLGILTGGITDSFFLSFNL